MKILKFGGTSLGTADSIRKVVEIILDAKQRCAEIAVCVSAFAGVTDELIAVAALAAGGDEDYRERLKILQNRHIETLRALVPAAGQSAVLIRLKVWFYDLADILHGVYLVREHSKRGLDYVMSFGELFSACVLSETLRAQGVAAELLDARQVIKTDDSFGMGRVNFALSNRLIADHFKRNSSLQVITGFIASTQMDDTITLGRGGSDYSASIFGAALGAEEVEIWTDVDGMMTADPRKVKKAFPQEQVTYEEAMELSHFGAKVVHPPTMQPALDKGIPIRIRNTFNPAFKGTLIHAAVLDGALRASAATGISSIEKISLVRVEGSGMIGVAGIAMRLFGAIAEAQISIILITQASSEHTICLAVRPEDAAPVKSLVRKEFGLEIEAKLINEAVLEDGFSIVSVVGENMRAQPGTAGKMFGALGKNGINVAAIAQGSSELNISAVVPRKDEVKALNALHDEFFFPDTKVINVFLAGKGLIGGALLRQIESHRQKLREHYAHEVRLIGIADSRRMLVSEDGLPPQGCLEMLERCGEPNGIARFLDRIRSLNLPSSVFVDCTASGEVASRYEEILRSSISVVTPNKKAQSGSFEYYSRLKRAAGRRGVKLLIETSVGAGLPVLSTLNDLIKSGDEILKIEAVLSGTLSFIFNSFGPGLSFSSVVRRAREEGYTEPDPRDDLNGLDVARKILILARESGLVLEISQVEVENLVPENCRGASCADEFLAMLPECDDRFEDLRRAAESKGGKLCYIASLEDGRAKVALQEITDRHPFWGLSGSDNIISFTTKRYHTRPLVVRGPGAGAEVTAAGVFADLIRIAE